MQPDRRHTRSSQRGRALDLQLAACLRAGALDAIVLGDDDGLVVAAAGPSEACAELAAGAAGPSDACTFAIDGARLHVIAQGGAVTDRRREVARAAAGAHRILAA
ncbi:MAG: hypothetical protein IPL61_36780 [Myxococcales bacterium]|nr:hypothetical protein [Myxococcales bacterium]